MSRRKNRNTRLSSHEGDRACLWFERALVLCMAIQFLFIGFHLAYLSLVLHSLFFFANSNRRLRRARTRSRVLFDLFRDAASSSGTLSFPCWPENLWTRFTSNGFFYRAVKNSCLRSVEWADHGNWEGTLCKHFFLTQPRWYMFIDFW